MNDKSRIKIFSSQNTFEGNFENSLDKRDFPIMNSVRQILTKDHENSYKQPFDRPGSIRTTESRDSTKVIRERLKNKIDTLRDRISNSHKDTVRSIQEKLNVPLNKISLTYDNNNAGIDTVRIHSRDGSKSIEGSGLELDDYVNINS